jgi:hypothetical protein
VILSEPGFAQAKEEGETTLGLDGEKVFSPKMIRRGHSERERERENSTATNAATEKWQIINSLY